jgi:hypothetical protein
MPVQSEDWAGMLYSLDQALISMKRFNPSAESIARANRQRFAREEGARAIADIQQQATAIRKNMERLRSLREARDALEADTLRPDDAVPKKKSKKIALAT